MKYLTLAVFIGLIAAMGCDSSVNETPRTTSDANEELVLLIDDLVPDGVMQVSRTPDAVLPSWSPGDSGILENGIYWRRLTDDETLALAFKGQLIAGGPHDASPNAVHVPDCSMETDGGLNQTRKFLKCVKALIDVCDGADVYNDDESGNTNADGWNRVFDNNGQEVGRSECSFPEE